MIMSIRLINRFFSLLYGRAIVREGSLGRGVAWLRVLLEDKGFEGFRKIPEHVYVALAQEACIRAAEEDPDKLPRYGKYYNQLHLIADSLIAAMSKGSFTDARVKGILEFNKLL